MIVLCRTLRVLACNHRLADLTVWATACLTTLKQCQPGFVHDRILIRLSRASHRVDTMTVVQEIRDAFTLLHLPDPLERISCNGWLLRTPITLVEADTRPKAPSNRQAAARSQWRIGGERWTMHNVTPNTLPNSRSTHPCPLEPPTPTS